MSGRLPIPDDPQLIRVQFGRAKRRAWFAAVYATLLVSSLVMAQEISVPGDLQAKFLMKSLMFDRQFKPRGPKGLIVVILSQNHFRQSLLAAEEFRDALVAVPDAPGGAIQVRLIDLEAEGPVAEIVKRYKPDILYVPPLRAVSLDDITATCRAEKVRSFSAVPEYVRGGVSLGLDTKGTRPVILVNLPAARAEGADYESRFLQLAVTIE